MLSECQKLSPLFNQNFQIQLEDLESGYHSKLLESGYHFTETDIESRFQQLHASLKNNMAMYLPLNWTMLFTKMNKFKKKSMPCITSLLVKSNHKKVVKKLVKQLPGYLKHAKDNNSNLAAEVERLGKTFVLNESFQPTVKKSWKLSYLHKKMVVRCLEDSSETQKGLFYRRRRVRSYPKLS